MVFVLYLTTKPELYASHCFKISLLLSFALVSLSLLATANLKGGSDDAHAASAASADPSRPADDISAAGLYAIYVAVTLLLYTAVPLPLYATVLIGAGYTVFFEALLCMALTRERTGTDVAVAVNVLLHIVLHVIGIHTVITTQVGIIFYSE